MAGYRDYYDKSLQFLIEEELKHDILYWAEREAKKRLRMYANLFCRDMRKVLIKPDSRCALCGTTEKLSIDHIIAVINGGTNTIDNVQILCNPCNNKKRRQ